MQKITLDSIEQSACKEIVYLTFNTSSSLDFKEWQFVMLETIDFFSNQEVIKRAYSLASTVSFSKMNNQVCFYVKKASEAGMSYYLTQKIKIGESVMMSQAYGHLVDPKKYSKYLFISIGSGIAPLYSMYKDLIQAGNYDKIVNIFGEKHSKSYLPRFLHDFATNDSKVKNILYTSRDTQVSDPFIDGHVQDGLKKAIIFLDNNDFITFICGTPKMVEWIKSALLQLGLSKDQILSEAY